MHHTPLGESQDQVVAHAAHLVKHLAPTMSALQYNPQSSSLEISRQNCSKQPEIIRKLLKTQQTAYWARIAF